MIAYPFDRTHAPLSATATQVWQPAAEAGAPSRSRRRAGSPGVGAGLALLLAVIVFVCGCRATTVHTHVSQEAGGFGPGTTLVVVPFENLSNHRNAGLAVTDLATSVLLAQGYFRVQEAGQVQEDDAVRYRRLETTPWERQLGANPVAAAAVGRACQVDAVLAGSVGEYGFVDGFGETATVGITVRLVDSATTQVVWSGTLSRRVGSVAFSEESAHRLAHQVLADLLGRMDADLRHLND